MKGWRPEGWKNPHQGLPTVEIFEAGADALLEALKEKGAWMTPEQMKLLAPDRKYPYGYIVFIPTERGHRTVDEICKTRAKIEIFAGYYGDDNIPKVCPCCNGEIVLRRKTIGQDDTVPVGICDKCDIAWVTEDRHS